MRTWAVVIAVAGLLAPHSARAQNEQVRPPLVRFEPWDAVGGRLAFNRWTILDVSRRAKAVPAGAARPQDAAARSRARDALLAALKSSDDAVAAEAALALGRAGDAADVTTLARIVAERKAPDGVLRNAALGLGALPLGDAEQSKAAREALLDGLRSAYDHGDKYPWFWTDCGVALAMRGDASVVPQIAQTLKQLSRDAGRKGATSGDAIGATYVALGVLGGVAALPDLEAAFDRTTPAWTTCSCEWAAVHAARAGSGAAALPFLRRASRGDATSLECNEARAVALHALGVVAGPKDEETFKLLKAAVLADVDVQCREAAMLALGRTGHPAAGETLQADLERVNSAERPSAIVGIGLAVRGTPDSKLEASMVKSLERCTDEDDRIAWTVACGLGRVQGARAAVASLVPRKRRGIGVPAACFALGLLGPDEAGKKLLREVVEQDDDATARREAAIALALQHDPEVVPQLRDIVASRRKDVDRAAAAICLGIVGDDADIDALLECVRAKATSDQLRACAIQGLGRLLDATEGGKLRKVIGDARLRTLRPDGVDPYRELLALVE